MDKASIRKAAPVRGTVGGKREKGVAGKPHGVIGRAAVWLWPFVRLWLLSVAVATRIQLCCINRSQRTVLWCNVRDW